jgi:hypothetical protein
MTLFQACVSLKPRPHLCILILYADTCPRTMFGNICGLFAYCTQTIYLYADSVCCLPARMGNNRQSLQVWTCPRTVRAHLFPSMCQFTRRSCVVNTWSKERVVTFIEDLQFSACLWGVHCADCKNRNKKGDASIFLQKI